MQLGKAFLKESSKAGRHTPTCLEEAEGRGTQRPRKYKIQKKSSRSNPAVTCVTLATSLGFSAVVLKTNVNCFTRFGKRCREEMDLRPAGEVPGVHYRGRRLAWLQEESGEGQPRSSNLAESPHLLSLLSSASLPGGPH